MPNSNNKLQVIRKSNELIEARYKLSIAEQRLILLLASEISFDDEDFQDYEIRVADFARMFGLESDKSLYEKVEQAAESLVGQKLRLRDNKVTEVTTWLSYIRYEEGCGVVKLRFDKSLKPYFLQLKTHFTQYNFGYAMHFKSQYSIRLYEILKMDSYKVRNGQFEKTIEVKELRLLFGIEKGDYPFFANLKKRVIEPAIKEISQKTDLDILDMRYGKTGRKVTNITFVASIRSENETREKQTKASIGDKKPAKEEGEKHSVIDSLVSLGFSEETAKSCKTKHGVKKIERNIAYTLAKKEEGVVKSIPAYLSKAIEGDWGGAWEVEQTREKERRKQTRLDEDKTREDEARKADEKKKEAEALINDFLALPEEKRGALIVEFLGGLSGIMKKKIEGIFTKLGENAVRENKVFRASFMPFLKSKILGA